MLLMITAILITLHLCMVTTADLPKQPERQIYVCSGDVASYTNKYCEEKGDVVGCYYDSHRSQFHSCGQKFNGSSVSFETTQAAKLLCPITNSTTLLPSTFLEVYCVNVSTTTTTTTEPPTTMEPTITMEPASKNISDDSANKNIITKKPVSVKEKQTGHGYGIYAFIGVVVVVCVISIVCLVRHFYKKHKAGQRSNQGIGQRSNRGIGQSETDPLHDNADSSSTNAHAQAEDGGSAKEEDTRV